MCAHATAGEDSSPPIYPAFRECATKHTSQLTPPIHTLSRNAPNLRLGMRDPTNLYNSWLCGCVLRTLPVVYPH